MKRPLLLLPLLSLASLCAYAQVWAGPSLSAERVNAKYLSVSSVSGTQCAHFVNGELGGTGSDCQNGSSSLPSGAIVLSLTSCPTGFSQVTALDGFFIQGTLAAHGDVGTTGGNATITPAGTISQPTFTGDPITQVINHTHAVTITDPGHNHTQNAHSHTEQLQGGTTGSTTGTNLMGSASTGGSLRSAAQSTTSTTATNNSSTTGITASTSNPAGGVSSVTPSGTVSRPTFTGTPLDPRPAFVKVIFCSAN